MGITFQSKLIKDKSKVYINVPLDIIKQSGLELETDVEVTLHIKDLKYQEDITKSLEELGFYD